MDMKFTRRQIYTLFMVGLGNLFNSMCISLQAPFFPKEAELKGVSASQYGFVFGVFELVGFLSAPVFGHYMNNIGPQFLFNCGLLTTSISSTLFGTISRIDEPNVFIGFAFVIRIFEGIGNAAFLTAAFPIIAKEFPNSVATTFASMETFFGIGLFIGPMVGGLLYSAGGFYLPFLVVGVALMLTVVVHKILLPIIPSDDKSTVSNVSTWSILKIPDVLGFSLGIVVTSTSIGFLSAILEPHLANFKLSPPVLGAFFVVTGAFYAFGSPLIGWLIDRFLNAKICVLMGSIVCALGFTIVGPAPFLKIRLELWTIVIGLILYGFGVASTMVACFAGALKSAIDHGFPDNTDTYGFISGLLSSTFSLGAFIGPSVAGLLYDSMGFARASYFMIGFELLLAFVFLILILVSLNSMQRHVGRYSSIPLAKGNDDSEQPQLKDGEEPHSSRKLFEKRNETTPLLG